MSPDDVHYSHALGVLCHNDLLIPAGRQGTAFGINPKSDSKSLFLGTKHICHLPLLCLQKKSNQSSPKLLTLCQFYMWCVSDP